MPIETLSAQSIKAHDLRKQVQQEQLTLTQWEERLARLKQQNAKTSRVLVELKNSQNLDGSYTIKAQGSKNEEWFWGRCKGDLVPWCLVKFGPA